MFSLDSFFFFCSSLGTELPALVTHFYQLVSAFRVIIVEVI
jgi:hypothetical protein